MNQHGISSEADEKDEVCRWVSKTYAFGHECKKGTGSFLSFFDNRLSVLQVVPNLSLDIRKNNVDDLFIIEGRQ